MRREQPLPSGSFFGQVRVRRELPGFALTHLVHARPHQLPSHSHAHAYFTMLRRGNYAEEYGRNAVTYPTGSVHFHPPGVIHRDAIGPGGASFLIVEIGDELFRRACSNGRSIPFRRPKSRQDLREGDLAQAGRRLEREAFDPARRSPLVMEGLVLEMLGLVTRADEIREDSPVWLTRIIDRLHADLAQPVTIRQLARDTDVHPVRLSRAFRRRLGIGVGEYVQRLRVRFVEERLGKAGVELAQLALDAGFTDQSHMTRVFRRITGRTPGQARDQDRE